ncbi:MAG: RNA ligase [Pseudomonadota bacterium]
MIRIEYIDDVLPHIPRDAGIIVSDRQDYQVIDYVYAVDETFIDPMARECRGLKFAPDGRILARPFHKFFNLGEKERIENIDWSLPHRVLDKLDGSMVHPCRLGGRLVFMTRMGVTEQAEAAQAVADASVLGLCEEALASGITPIFEFTSPGNRIVIAYDRPALTLLAARETVSGRYLTHDETLALAVAHGVPLVRDLGPVMDPDDFVAGARALEGAEGYVIAFDDGHRVKVKADAYVLRHRILSDVSHERNVLAIIVEDGVDDVLALLPPEVGDEVAAYRDRVHLGVARQIDVLQGFVAPRRDLTRKDFALAVKANLDQRLWPVAFAMYDGSDGRDRIMGILNHASGSAGRLDTVRDLFDLTWPAASLPETAY